MTTLKKWYVCAMLRICIKGERELQEYRFDFESHLFSFQLATIVIGMNVCFKRSDFGLPLEFVLERILHG